MTDSAVPFITRVRVKDFRSIAECDVTLGPLTVLVGPNAAGKSNFLDAIRFVRDAIADGLPKALATRGGLDALLHRRGKDTVADSFRIQLDRTLHIVPDASPTTVCYKIEIGRDQSGHPSVLFEHWRSSDPHAPHTPGHFVRAPGRHGGTAIGGDVNSELRAARLLPQELFASRLTATHADPFRDGFAPFRSIGCYDLDIAVLRGLDQTLSPYRGDVLGPAGEHLGHLLGILATEHPLVKETIDGYLAAIIDNCLGVDQKIEGRYSAVCARFILEGDRFDNPIVKVFERESLPEGMLRLAGVLVALFQPRALSGDMSLMMIENPERSIYPARVGALYEALAAARSTQVIVSTQSSHLLDNKAAMADHLLVAEMTNGVTRVGPLDEDTLALLTEHPSDITDMHRQGHLQPTGTTANRIRTPR